MENIKKGLIRAAKDSGLGVRVRSALARRERRRKNEAEARYLESLGGRHEIFAHHYQTNKWGDTESVSGAGSTEKYTENIRAHLPKLFQECRVHTMLDAPCGDYNWFRLIQFRDRLSYIGGDIVPALIDRNRARFVSEDVSFMSLDIVRDPLPKVNLWLCRDCLFHLSENEVALAIENFLRSEVRYLLTSTHPLCGKNSDIQTGSFRLLNLRIPPYSFGEPLALIDDWIDGFPVRQLGLWERESLTRDLDKNAQFQRLLRKAREP